MTAALHIQGVQKRFGAVHALRGIDLEISEGSVHAICGENGAGKSTLFGILSGIHTPDSGTLRIFGEPYAPRHIRDAERHGLAIIHQELALIGELTVAENLFLGRELRRGVLLDHDAMQIEAARVLPELDPATRVRDLSVARAQLVEITRAMMKRCRVLLLDEPSAALSELETRALLDRVRGLSKQGVACVYVSHRLQEVLTIADRVTVLRDGRTVSTRERAEVDETTIVRDMVGRELDTVFPPRSRTRGEPVLAVRDLSVRGPRNRRVLDRVDFTLHKGEVLGVSGLMGAGRSELLLHLFGAFGVRERGEVLLHGQPFHARSPGEAIDRGVALVPEDRRHLGLFMQQSIAFHVGDADISRLRVVAPSPDTIVSTLSGGNQQKIVLARSLGRAPTVLLLDEPTRGVDVGAKRDIYEWIAALAAEGLAVLLVSSELQELIGMCDRVVVLARGTVSKTITGATEHTLLEAAL